MLFPADPLQLPDVKLWLFSRRIFGGADTENATRVCRPRAVYAHSSVLNKADYFHGGAWYRLDTLLQTHACL